MYIVGKGPLTFESPLIIFANRHSLSCGESYRCLRTDRFSPVWIWAGRDINALGWNRYTSENAQDRSAE